MKILSFGIVLLLSTFSFAQTDIQLIQTYFLNHSQEFRLDKEQVMQLRIVSSMSSKAPNTRHAVVQQFLQGIPVQNSRATITLWNKEVKRVSKGLQVLPSSPLFNDASISADQAISSACKQLGLVDFVPVLEKRGQDNLSFVFAPGNVSRVPIPVRKMYKIIGNECNVIWDLSIFPLNQEHWWSMHVDAQTGEVIFKNDWMNSCQFDVDVCSHENHMSHPAPLAPPPPPGADQYMVYALPLISPNDGNRSLVVNPSDVTYSPYGWHDTDGNVGDEYTITRGNNVYASDDIDDDDVPGYSPDGTSTLNFNFPYDSLVGVQGNLDAVVTNLFYMNNMMHDIWAYYGFDEVSGNFQETNYTGNGLGMDFVYADAQDGSGTNNANFGTPPDGANPRMQMFLWTSSNVPDLLTINAPGTLAGSYNASTAGFGPPVPTVPITEDLVLVIDDGSDVNDGCDIISNGASLAGKIAVVKRGNCTFAAKVENIQNYGALAVIVVNNTGGAPIAMGGTSATVTIPSIMVSQANGNSFINELNNSGTVNGTIVNPGDLTATDSDFDNMIIAHEYGHGISNRLVGGPDNTDCLFNAEQMGEGWSDWFGLMITQKPGDVANDPRGVGTYVTNQPNNGTGIRPAPYSVAFSVNDYTYGNTNNNSLSQPHGIGFVWASMLWDLNWALIDQYGFSSNVKSGTAGNNIAMALVTEGLKLTPCGPGFVNGRDAILAADSLLYNGANQCLIWEVFARRGLGFSASQGDSDDRSDQVEAFDIAPSCSGSGLGLNENSINEFKVYPNPTSGNLTVLAMNVGDIQFLQLVDMSGKLILEMEGNSNQVNLNINSLKQGMYLLKIQTEVGYKTIRIEKK